MIESKTIDAICHHYGIGEAKTDLSELVGGYSHINYKLTTSTGPYVIKQLCLGNTHVSKIVENLEKSNEIAAIFHKSKVPLISAMSPEGRSVFSYDGDYFQVFHFTEARIIESSELNKQQANYLSDLLAKLHRCSMKEVRFNRWENDSVGYVAKFNVEHWQHWSELFSVSHSPFTDALTHSVPILESLFHYSQNVNAYPELCLVSHRDINQFNVLWDENQCVLIDWEGAGCIDREFECLAVALEWSGLTTGKLNKEIYQLIINNYFEIMQSEFHDINNAFKQVVRSWLHWLDNLLLRIAKQQFTVVSEADLSISIVDTLKTIQYLERLKAKFPSL